GAQALKTLGHSHARASGLNDDTTALHRLAMTELHLAASKAGVTIRTDRALRYNDTELRPDHQVMLPDGNILFFEVEQKASAAILRRIVESLQHKQDFFASRVHPNVLPEVRMLLHLKRNKEWDKTIKVWERALGVVKENAKGKLRFRLLAIPLREFLDAPDWGIEHELFWKEVLPPQPQTGLVAAAPENLSTLMQRTAREDHLVLRALWQDFNERIQPGIGLPKADPEFFQLIYSASHDERLPLIEQAAMPNASLYLLRRYLEMKQLRGRIRNELHRGERDTRWNITTILHRMQGVAKLFLTAHGWRTYGLLLVQSSVNDLKNRETRIFDFIVRIREPQILMDRDDLVVPSKKEVQAVEEALSWVMYALFAYSEELGLGGLSYW
ncbi:MAG TPA: hypothetical protein PLF42_03025, partial [Anaerolineales bacterium]|nr:hypothetical protein [Anaerolineales bacterium]